MKKTALIMNHNSYAGREYLSQLKNINLDVITIGNYAEINAMEEERCGGFWKPDSEPLLKKSFNFFNFESLQSNDLIEFLKKNEYEIGIQGGTGILKLNVIELFSIGIVNFHPGDLPQYRGSSAPEWQLFENQNVISTAHFIDEGIDTGKIICKKKLNLNNSSYEKFRASVYPETAIFVHDLILNLQQEDSLILNAEIQDDSKAIYRNYIGEERIKKLKMLFPLNNSS
tara:strand:+ start:191 stop:874 length:684 start_codon:yes stop_codon:yes gene_type:complete